MFIASTRCLNASNRHALGLSHCWLSHCRRLYSNQVDIPPHLAPNPTGKPPLPLEVEPRVKPYYITTPIFYPNAVPHIGHLYSLVVADIFARNARLTVPLDKRPVHFITGTDEHGLKIQKAAQERKMEPQEFCDHLCLSFTGLAKQAMISHTNFVRTSEVQHCYNVKTLWKRLVNAGYVYLGEHSGWYSVSDECFYTELQVRDALDPKTGKEVKVSIETGNVVEWTKEQNYKFALSKFKTALLEHFRANPGAIYPPNQRNNVMNVLESDDERALPDLSISRPSSRLKWGIPVPGDSSQTIYVWLDALASYLTGIGYPWLDHADMLSHGWPVDLQIIGKDILKFHAMYFPAFLMALDLPLPRALLSHAHWTVKRAKMSKSVGNVVDPVVVLKEHGVDAVRWYLARTGGYFKSDVDWNDDQLVRSTDELRSLLGNVLLRLQSKKILERLPPAFQEVPLHRAILLTRSNASSPLFEPGSDTYDDRLEDRRFGFEISRLGSGIDYAKEYTDPLAFQAGLPSDPPAARTSGVVWYWELSEGNPVDEATIVSVELRDALNVLRGKVCHHLQHFEVGDATQSIVDVLSLLNKEITRIKPWSDETSPREIIHILTWGRETLRICGILLQPFIPSAAQTLLDALHIHPKTRTYAFACIGAGRVRPGPLEKRTLFPKKLERTWSQVESDHKYEENQRKRKQLKRLEHGRPVYKIRHRRLLKPHCNKLYQRLFHPLGSPRIPNCFSPLRRRKVAKQTSKSVAAQANESDSKTRRSNKFRALRRKRRLLKSAKRKAREPL